MGDNPTTLAGRAIRGLADPVGGDLKPCHRHDVHDLQNVGVVVVCDDGVLEDAVISHGAIATPGLDHADIIRFDRAALGVSSGRLTAPERLAFDQASMPPCVPGPGAIDIQVVSGDDELRVAAERLAVAESRAYAHPYGVWVLDSALAAIPLIEALDDPYLISLCASRGALAVERLTRLPECVLTCGGDRFLHVLLEDIRPLGRWLGDEGARRRLDAWIRRFSPMKIPPIMREIHIASTPLTITLGAGLADRDVPLAGGWPRPGCLPPGRFSS